MSFPNIPDIIPSIELSKHQAINLLLASIAFEELGLAHIINSEAEKIQFVLGTLGCQVSHRPPTFEELLLVNRTVEKTLRAVIKSQMLLQFKLEDVLNCSKESPSSSTTSSTTAATTSTATKTTTSHTTTYTSCTHNHCNPKNCNYRQDKSY